MMIHATKCEVCGCLVLSPFTRCKRCDPDGARDEREALLAVAKDALPCMLDMYGDAIIAWMPDRVVRVRDAGLFMRTGARRNLDQLVADITKLRDENTELLAENARLRRALERSERRKG